MKGLMRVFWPVLLLLVPLPGYSQANEESDPLLRVVELASQVYFDDAGGAPVVIPAGDYWVDADDNTLKLVTLDGASTYALAATADTHDNEIDADMALAYDGGEELPDAIFVALMSPDGQQLTAGGSLSGVQARGRLDEARKRAAAIRAAAAAAQKMAADRARQAAAQKARQARALAQEAAATAGQAAQTVGETAQTVGENIQTAIPGTPFKDLVDAAQSIGVRELLACLSNVRDSRQNNIGEMAKQFANDPAAAIASIQSDIQAAVDNRMKDFSVSLDKVGADPSPAQIVDAAFDMLASIGEDRPAVGCLLAVVEPKIPQLKRDIIRRQQAVLAQVDRTVNDEIIPTILGDVGDTVAQFALGEDRASQVQSRGALERVGATGVEFVAIRKWEREAMASGLFIQSLTDQYMTATAAINDALNNSSPEVQDIREAVALTSQWSDDSAIRFGVGMVRYRGHRQIDSSHGLIQRMIRKSGKLEAFGRRVAIKIVSSLCGLVPEAGAAICNVVFVPVEAIAIFVVERTVTGIIEGSLHKTWGASVDALQNHLVDGGAPAAQDQGPFLRVLLQLDRQDIASAAENDLPPGFKQALLDYNASINRVIDRWEEERL